MCESHPTTTPTRVTCLGGQTVAKLGMEKNAKVVARVEHGRTAAAAATHNDDPDDDSDDEVEIVVEDDDDDGDPEEPVWDAERGEHYKPCGDACSHGCKCRGDIDVAKTTAEKRAREENDDEETETETEAKIARLSSTIEFYKTARIAHEKASLEREARDNEKRAMIQHELQSARAALFQLGSQSA